MEPTKPRVTVTYSLECELLLALYMVGEILSAYQDEIAEAAMLPSRGGRFRIEVDGQVVWDGKRDGGVPDIKELKQRIRDHVAPGRDLGHLDCPGP